MAASGIRGLSLLRGMVLPVVALALALGLSACGVSDRERAMKAGSAGPVHALRERVENQADR